MAVSHFTPSLAPLQRRSPESNRKDLSLRTAFTMRQERNCLSLTMFILFFMNFFGPLHKFWRLEGLPYSYLYRYIILIYGLTLVVYRVPINVPYHVYIYICISFQISMFRLLFRYANLMYPRLVCRIRFSFALLETYASSLTYNPHCVRSLVRA